MGFKIDEPSMKNVEDKISSVKSFATKALGFIGIGFSLTQMNALAEEFNGINDQIKSATAGLGNQKEIQEKIMKSANDTKMSYADTARTAGALVQENKELFGNIDQALAFTDALTKTFKVAGKSNEEIAGLMEAVNKSFAKGKVDTETLNQLMERSPEAVEFLNKQLGSTTDQLEQLAADGKISLADLKDAFVLNADEIDSKFAGLDYSISDALLNIRNRWGYWLDDINASIGLTSTLARFMTRAFDGLMKGLNKARDVAVKVVDKFGGIENVLRLIAIAAGIAFAAFKGQKILSFLKSLTSMLNVANLKIMAIIAVIIAIALIVEDFIRFMQGGNSMIGEALKKMGYDVDEVRDRIITGWNKVKGFLIQAWLAISGAAGAVMDKLREFWVNNGEEIMERVSAIWEGLKKILSFLWNLFVASFGPLGPYVRDIFGSLGDFWDEWGERITGAFSAIFGIIGDSFMAFLKFIQGVIDFLAGMFSGDWEQAWNGICEIFTGIWDGVLAFLTGVWDAIYNLFGEKIDAILEKVREFAEKVKEKIEGVKEFFGGIGNFFTGGATVRNTTVANATGTGNKTNNISQDVKIENTFNGTDQETMSRAASKSAQDTTDQLARGLKYGT